jgi:predicted ester cyclase
MSSMPTFRRFGSVLSVFGLLLVCPATAIAVEQSTEELAAKIARVEEAVWNRAEVEKLDEIYASNVVLHMGGEMQLTGTEEFKQLIRMFHAEIPDRHFEIDEIFAAGDRITERYTWSGTHRRTGKPLKVTGCVVFHVEGDRIVEAWNYEDMLGLYQQLGLVSGSPFGPPGQ